MSKGKIKVNGETLISLSLAAIYLIFSFYFAEERICFADTANMFLKIVNTEYFNIEAGRYPQVLTQIPALLAIWLSFSLSWVIIIYSLSFPTFYICMALVGYRYFSFRYSILLLMFSLVGAVSVGYFHTGTETHQAIAWAVLFLSWIVYDEKQLSHSGRNKHIAFGFLLTVLLLHVHPVGVFFVIFGLAASCALGLSFKSRTSLVVITITVLLTIVKVLLTEEGSYDSQFLSELPLFPKLISEINTNWSLNFFLERITSTYLLISIAFVFSSVWLLLTRSYRLLVLHLLFNSLFFLFTILIYHQGDSELMMERAFMPFAFFTIASMVLAINSTQVAWHKTFAITSLLLLTLCGFNVIYKKGEVMSERLAYMDTLHRKYQRERVFLHLDEVNRSYIEIPWSYSLETLIYSASVYGKTGCYSIIPTDSAGLVFAQPERPEVFMTNQSFGRILFEDLNKNYFNVGRSIFISDKLRSTAKSFN